MSAPDMIYVIADAETGETHKVGGRASGRTLRAYHARAHAKSALGNMAHHTNRPLTIHRYVHESDIHHA